MSVSIVRLQVSVIAMIVASGCQNEILLVPEEVVSDDQSPFTYTNFLDGRYWSYWRGLENYEIVDFYFSSTVDVKEILVQRYGLHLNRVSVWSQVLSTHWGLIMVEQYLPAELGSYFILTARVNFETTALRFLFRSDDLLLLSRVEVYGCYVTSNPTNLPTTEGPTVLPSSFPTTSPTLPPTTTLPTEAPSIMPSTSPTLPPTITLASQDPSVMPTTSPTLTPTTANPTRYPSTFPTSSPTGQPSSIIITATPSSSPTTLPTTVSPTKPPSVGPTVSPTVGPTLLAAEDFRLVLRTNELLIVAIIIFCAVLLMLMRRNRRHKEVKNILKLAEVNAKDTHQRIPDIEDETYVSEPRVAGISELERATESFCQNVGRFVSSSLRETEDASTKC